MDGQDLLAMRVEVWVSEPSAICILDKCMQLNQLTIRTMMELAPR
jgi:hypothetical protein